MAGTSYTRQSSFSDGDTITAALFNNEFTQLVNAFSYASSSTTGHRHDGTSGEGGNIHTIGDQDFLNKIVADSTNNRWGIFVQVSSSAVEQIRVQDGAIVPVTDNDIDLGTSSLEFKDAYFDGTITTDLLTVSGTTNLDGAIQVDNTITVGVDDTGYDVKFFGDTASAYMLWDASADDLVLAGAAGIDLAGDIDVDGTANLDNTDIDGTLAVDGTTISLDATTSLNIDNSNTSNGITIGTATSGVPISIGHTTSEVTVNDNLTVTGTLTLGSGAELTEAELEMLDGITAGTVAASKAVVVDSNKDAASFRNITLTGELDAATLDISGNADIDGTLEADAYTVDGTALNEYIADTVGAMVSSNTETNITVTYEDGDNTLDFVIGTLNQDTTGTADNITISANNSTDETVYPIFVDGATGSQGAESDTGFTYNPSSGLLTISGELDAGSLDISGNADIDGTLEADAYTVDGTALNEYIADTVGAMVSSNTETNITVTYEDGDNTLDFVIGTLNQDTTGTAALATSITASANNSTDETVYPTFVDGATGSQGIETDTGFTYNPSSGLLTISGELDAGSLDISGNADIDGTLEADAITVDGTALNEYIADTIGAMVGSNTETGITVTYEDGDNTLDFVIGTLNQDTTGNAATFTASANNSTDETVYPVFVDGATGSQGAETDTGFTYNPSSGLLTIAGELDAGSLDISGNADIDGTTNLDAVDIDGAVQIDNTVTVGVDDTGYDVKFFGATASAYMLWDESVDDLILAGAARAVVPDGQLVLGSTAVSSTAAELNILDGKAFLDEDDMSSNSATGIASQQSIKAYVDANAGSMTSFQLEDDDGTEIAISNAKEVKFIGSGITTNWTDTDNGTDGDPYDLTFTVDAAQTGITSLLATDIKIGEDDQTKIDFETADEIHFYAANVEQVYLGDNIFGPQTDSDVDLGATGVRWKDAFVDSITVTGEVDAASLDISGNADIDGTTNLDAVDIDGAVQLDNTLTVGVDDTGYDVKLFGATASKYMLWDESADSLIVKDIVDAVNYKINGGQGSDGQVLTSTGSGVAWEAVSGGGKVLQVVTAQGGSEIQTSSTLNDTGLSADITPAATSSKILVMVNSSSTYNNGSAGLEIAILRGTTEIQHHYIVGSSGSQFYPVSMQVLDSPSTTSATTYKVQHASSNGSSLVGFCAAAGDAPGDDVGTIILIEIGA